MNGSNKLECLSLAGLSSLVLCNTRAYWADLSNYEENVVLWIWSRGPNSQDFIFFITYKLAQLARLFHNTKLERLASAEHYNLLDQFVSYEENVLLWIRTQGPSSQHFIFFVTYQSAQ